LMGRLPLCQRRANQLRLVIHSDGFYSGHKTAPDSSEGPLLPVSIFLEIPAIRICLCRVDRVYLSGMKGWN
jgi:hypothetical protein